MRRSLLALLVLLFGTLSAQAEVKLPRIFSEHMVLQRETPVPVWGTADSGERVTIEFAGQTKTTTAATDGQWAIKLEALPTSAEPRTMAISGSQRKWEIKDILVGDVWLCSGQSNMEMGLGGCNAPQDVAAADYPTLRRIKVAQRALAKPSAEVPGQWEVCTPHNAAGFTAAGFYFACRIQKETGLPIGLLDDNWGGTRIEPWIPPVGFELEPSLSQTLVQVKKWEQEYRENLRNSLDKLEKWLATTRQALAAGGDLPAAPDMPQNPLANPGNPMSIYNGMIHPVVPYAIKGALWYQGESNGGEGEEYYHKMRALIGGWRKIWNQGEFPCYYVQLANWQQPNNEPAGGDGWAKVRMAQLKSLQIPHTGMAVIIDVGDASDIHPRDKFDVGERLALWALAKDYGQTSTVYSGPLYKSMQVEGQKIRLAFDCVGAGLMVGKKDGRQPTVEDQGGKLKRFAIAGEDRKWVWADAVIDGETVVVSAATVAQPVAVRYAYSMNPEGCNLYNRAGLPTSPFRTDDW
jgi:sialate O-acetylesterase